jgi:hypothetical protein
LKNLTTLFPFNIFQLTAIDEIHVEQTKSGHVVKQLCRVRVFFLSFLTGQRLCVHG